MEVENELDAHVTDIEAKFISIIDDACKLGIDAAATEIEWDGAIEKN